MVPLGIAGLFINPFLCLLNFHGKADTIGLGNGGSALTLRSVDYSSLTARFKTFQNRVRQALPERQIYFRSDGRLHFYTLTTGAQTAIVSGLILGTVASLTFWTVALFVDDPLTIRTRELAESERRYEALNVRLDRVTSEALLRADILEERQQYLERVLQENLGSSVATDVSESPSEGSPTGGASAAMPEDLENGLADDKKDIGAELDLIDPDNKTIIRVRALDAHLEGLIAKQSHLIRAVEDVLHRDVAEIERVFAMAGLTSDQVFDYHASNAAAQGGPLTLYATTPLEVDIDDSAFQALVEKVDQRAILKETLTRMPLAKPVMHYYVSSRFGRRRDPIRKYWAFHGGVDMAGLHRTPVHSTAEGLITFAGRNGPYGRMVEIDHGNGFKTRYGHLASILVKKGEVVDTGDRVALMGNTGRSTGTHLHYEIRFNGSPLNPEKFFEAAKHVQAN